MLAAPPDRDGIRQVSELLGDDTALGSAVSGLGAAARVASDETVEREFHDLFIGVGRGELVPFGSFYLAGFLMEKPLADLRDDMASLGIERAQGVHEPEDHIASVLEIMAAMIDGSFDLDVDFMRQRQFYEKHVGSWADRFFRDLEVAETARFYRAVGTLGREFLDIESTAITMAA